MNKIWFFLIIFFILGFTYGHISILDSNTNYLRAEVSLDLNVDNNKLVVIYLEKDNAMIGLPFVEIFDKNKFEYVFDFNYYKDHTGLDKFLEGDYNLVVEVEDVENSEDQYAFERISDENYIDMLYDIESELEVGEDIPTIYYLEKLPIHLEGIIPYDFDFFFSSTKDCKSKKDVFTEDEDIVICTSTKDSFVLKIYNKNDLELKKTFNDRIAFKLKKGIYNVVLIPTMHSDFYKTKELVVVDKLDSENADRDVNETITNNKNLTNNDFVNKIKKYWYLFVILFFLLILLRGLKHERK